VNVGDIGLDFGMVQWHPQPQTLSSMQLMQLIGSNAININFCNIFILYNPYKNKVVIYKFIKAYNLYHTRQKSTIFFLEMKNYFIKSHPRAWRESKSLPHYQFRQCLATSSLLNSNALVRANLVCLM